MARNSTPDLEIFGFGIYQLRALTARGRKWIEKRVMCAETIVMRDGSIAIDGGGFAADIVEGAGLEGLRVQVSR